MLLDLGLKKHIDLKQKRDVLDTLCTEVYDFLPRAALIKVF